jgi:hypothetical protein
MTLIHTLATIAVGIAFWEAFGIRSLTIKLLDKLDHFLGYDK